MRGGGGAGRDTEAGSGAISYLLGGSTCFGVWPTLGRGKASILSDISTHHVRPRAEQPNGLVVGRFIIPGTVVVFAVVVVVVVVVFLRGVPLP